MHEEIIQQVEAYLERHCHDSDWRAKRISPNWTSKEYRAFSTLEKYEKFIEYFKAQNFDDEKIKKYIDWYALTVWGIFPAFKTFESYGNFVSQLEQQGLNDEEISQELEKYLDEYVQENFRFSKVDYDYDYLESVSRTEKIIRALKDKIGLAGNYFSDYLFKLIRKKNLTEVEVYKKANLDRRLFSKIRKEKNYMPSKQTVLSLVIALELDSEEAKILLNRAGYQLTAGRKEDVIIEYFIENKIYDLFLINEVLEHYECPTLGN